jgi:hypothetical protein
LPPSAPSVWRAPQKWSILQSGRGEVIQYTVHYGSSTAARPLWKTVNCTPASGTDRFYKATVKGRNHCLSDFFFLVHPRPVAGLHRHDQHSAPGSHRDIAEKKLPQKETVNYDHQRHSWMQDSSKDKTAAQKNREDVTTP